MEIKRLEGTNRFSRSVVHNNTAYFAGITSLKEDLKSQTLDVFEKIEERLKELGADKTKILSATIFIKNLEDVAEFNELWIDWMPVEHAPARACVQAEMVRPEILVEICVIAAV